MLEAPGTTAESNSHLNSARLARRKSDGQIACRHAGTACRPTNDVHAMVRVIRYQQLKRTTLASYSLADVAYLRFRNNRFSTQLGQHWETAPMSQEKRARCESKHDWDSCQE